MTSCTHTSACDTIGAVLERAVAVPDAGPASLRLPAGSGRLRVEPTRRGSVVTRAYAISPLRFLTPRNHGTAAWIYTSTYGGGLVDGDALDIEVEVAGGAAAFVSSQASTKVYRSPRGTRTALHANVDDDALLVVAPDPVVCFSGARYRQRQRFRLADGANLVVVDWLLAGRSAAGERWSFLEYESLLEVTVGDRLVLHDATALRALDGDLLVRLGRFDVLAVVVLAGPALRQAAAGMMAAASERPVVRRSDELLSAAPLGEQGCLVRLAGTSVEQVRGTVRQLLQFVAARLEDDPWVRKW
jgi:urease accessory protein